MPERACEFSPPAGHIVIGQLNDRTSRGEMLIRRDLAFRKSREDA
jgi:hypothetical protein